MRSGPGAPARGRIRQFPNRRKNGHGRRSGGRRSSPHQSRRDAVVWVGSTPQGSQRSGGPVLSALDAKMGGNAFAKLRIHSGHAGLAVHRDEALFLSKGLKFFFIFAWYMMKDWNKSLDRDM